MNPGVIGAFIPIVAITFGIGIGALSILTEHKRKSQLLEQFHRERLMALEKGLPPPDVPAGLAGFSINRSSVVPRFLWPRALRNGIALLLIGVVCFFAIDRAGGQEGALFALIPAAIGIANLVYAAVLRQQEQVDPPRTP